MKRSYQNNSNPPTKRRKRSPTRKSKSKKRSKKSRKSRQKNDLTDFMITAEKDFDSSKPLQLILPDDFFLMTPTPPKLKPLTGTPLTLSPFISPNFELPNEPFWKFYKGFRYNQIIDLCFSYIVQKYKNKLNVFVTKGLEIYIDAETLDKELLFAKPYLGFYDSLNRAIQGNYDFIIIPYGLYSYDLFKGHVPGSGHKCLVIINNILQTIEFFDSNGFISHEEDWQNKDYEVFDDLLEYFDSYFKVGFEASCPKRGFQHHEGLIPDRPEDLDGYCTIWSWFMADLRLSYPESEALHVQERYLKDIQAKYGDETSEFLRDFIVRYGNYIHSKIRPDTPTHPEKYEAIIPYHKNFKNNSFITNNV